MIGRSGYLACNAGNFSSRTTFKPGFCRPIAFKTPDLVSAIRGVAFPTRGSNVTALVINAPNWLRSYICAYLLSPKAKVPLAGIIGFLSFKPGNSTANLVSDT